MPAHFPFPMLDKSAPMHDFPINHALLCENREAATQAASAHLGTVRARVLVMDDEMSILDLTARMLRSQGYEVELTSDGDAALSRYQVAMETGRRFDLVILDLTVPAGMGGFDTFKALRTIDPAVKVIISSGYSHEPLVLHYKEHGIAGLAPKPYRLNDLLNAVSGVLAAA